MRGLLEYVIGRPPLVLIINRYSFDNQSLGHLVEVYRENSFLLEDDNYLHFKCTAQFSGIWMWRREFCIFDQKLPSLSSTLNLRNFISLFLVFNSYYRDL